MISRKWFKRGRVLVLLIVVIFGCPVTATVVVDVACNTSIETWLPLYPGAETVSVDYSFIRPRAMGSTLMVQQTPDDPQTVEAFYYDHFEELVSRGVPRGMGGTDFSAQENPDADGSLILLYSRCVV